MTYIVIKQSNVYIYNRASNSCPCEVVPFIARFEEGKDEGKTAMLVQPPIVPDGFDGKILSKKYRLSTIDRDIDL
jgi:hypothetical protein